MKKIKSEKALAKKPVRKPVVKPRTEVLSTEPIVRGVRSDVGRNFVMGVRSDVGRNVVRDVRSDIGRNIGYSPAIPKGFYDTPYPQCNEKRWR